jgi:hypothetical protein
MSQDTDRLPSAQTDDFPHVTAQCIAQQPPDDEPSCTQCPGGGCPTCMPWLFAKCTDCKQQIEFWLLEPDGRCTGCTYQVQCQLCYIRLDDDGDHLLCRSCQGKRCLGCMNLHTNPAKTVDDLCNDCVAFYSGIPVRQVDDSIVLPDLLPLATLTISIFTMRWRVHVWVL